LQLDLFDDGDEECGIVGDRQKFKKGKIKLLDLSFDGKEFVLEIWPFTKPFCVHQLTSN